MRALVLVGLLLLMVGAQAGGDPHGPAQVWSKKGQFVEVRAAVLEAITARGMVLSYTSHAATMLERTAAAAGVKSSVYGDAEILLFCKSGLSHALVAANPHNIVLCPYSISVYTLAGEPDKVYLAIPKPYVGEPAYAPIDKLLTEIVTEVIEW